jgi:prepilin-type N-terminal cleavage/methylation domain-containing protein
MENDMTSATLLPIEKNRRQKIDKKGFTLTEIAIVLGIIGLILGAIWTAAASVYANQRLTHTNTAILGVAQGIRSLYSTSSSTGYAAATLITPAMVSAGIIPTDLAAGTGPFPGGSMGVSATSDGLGFVVSVTAVPQSACINLLTMLGGESRDPGLYAASAVATAAPAAGDASTTGSPLTAPITPAVAIAAASGTAPDTIGGCTNPLNKVKFGFTVK